MTNLSDTSLGCFAQGTEGDMSQCVLDATFSAGPAPGLMGLVMAGVILTSLYVAGNGSVIVPAVITILFGSVMVPILPPQFQTFAYTVVAIGGTVAAFAAWSRFTSRGGFQ